MHRISHMKLVERVISFCTSETTLKNQRHHHAEARRDDQMPPTLHFSCWWIRFQDTIAQLIEANDYTATRFLPERQDRMRKGKENESDGETDFLPMRRTGYFSLLAHAFLTSAGHATVHFALQRGHRMNRMKKDAKNRNNKQRFSINVEMRLSVQSRARLCFALPFEGSSCCFEVVWYPMLALSSFVVNIKTIGEDWESTRWLKESTNANTVESSDESNGVTYEGRLWRLNKIHRKIFFNTRIRVEVTLVTWRL